MRKRVLITGGAGFIGSHLADELLSHGYEIRVLDSLCAQVHGASRRKPDYLSPEVEFLQGDVRNPAQVRKALEHVDAVYHFAAAVGVGQSMYELEHYVDTNNYGTAVLLEALLEFPVEKLVIASSMSIYGEGLCRTPAGRTVIHRGRSLEQLKSGIWELQDVDGSPLAPEATPESKTPHLSSVYALSKFDQEQMCLMIGRAYKIPTVALRFFNVYGTRQSLSNPYTGVLAIFASRFLNEKPPMIFEDGLQKRDFVSVRDVARACRLVLESDKAAGNVFNVGSGRAYEIVALAQTMGRILGKPHLEPVQTGKYRMGDIRHCFADITLARTVLGYEPRVALEEGVTELTSWLEGQIAQDHFEVAHQELAARGLTL